MYVSPDAIFSAVVRVSVGRGKAVLGLVSSFIATSFHTRFGCGRRPVTTSMSSARSGDPYTRRPGCAGVFLVALLQSGAAYSAIRLSFQFVVGSPNSFLSRALLLWLMMSPAPVS